MDATLFENITQDNLPEKLLAIQEFIKTQDTEISDLNTRITELQKLNMQLFTRATATVVAEGNNENTLSPEQELDNVVSDILGGK